MNRESISNPDERVITLIQPMYRKYNQDEYLGSVMWELKHKQSFDNLIVPQSFFKQGYKFIEYRNQEKYQDQDEQFKKTNSKYRIGSIDTYQLFSSKLNNTQDIGKFDRNKIIGQKVYNINKLDKFEVE